MRASTLSLVGNTTIHMTIPVADLDLQHSVVPWSKSNADRSYAFVGDLGSTSVNAIETLTSLHIYVV